MTLDAMPLGATMTIIGITARSPALVKAHAIGLRAGRAVEVIARSGRLVLVKVGHVRLAITRDLARHIEVRHP